MLRMVPSPRQGLVNPPQRMADRLVTATIQAMGAGLGMRLQPLAHVFNLRINSGAMKSA